MAPVIGSRLRRPLKLSGLGQCSGRRHHPRNDLQHMYIVVQFQAVRSLAIPPDTACGGRGQLENLLAPFLTVSRVRKQLLRRVSYARVFKPLPIEILARRKVAPPLSPEIVVGEWTGPGYIGILQDEGPAKIGQKGSRDRPPGLVTAGGSETSAPDRAGIDRLLAGAVVGALSALPRGQESRQAPPDRLGGRSGRRAVEGPGRARLPRPLPERGVKLLAAGRVCPWPPEACRTEPSSCLTSL